MSSKKQSRRKLDLTHLASLNTSVTSEPEPTKLAKEEAAPIELVKIEPQKPEKVVEPPPTPVAGVDSPLPPQEEPASIPSEAPKTVETRQFEKRPQRYEVKPLKTLQSSTNAAGESFKLGDKIQLTAPWGKKAIAEISLIYQDESANVWVHYVPIEEVPHNWSWLGGCSRAERLILAS